MKKRYENADAVRAYISEHYPQFAKLFSGISFSLWYGPTYTWADLTKEELLEALNSDEKHVNPEYGDSITWMWGDNRPERTKGDQEAAEEHFTALKVVDEVSAEMVEKLPYYLHIEPAGVFRSDKGPQETWDDYVEGEAEYFLSEMVPGGSYEEYAELGEREKEELAWKWASQGDGYDIVVLSRNEYLDLLDKETGPFMTGRY